MEANFSSKSGNEGTATGNEYENSKTASACVSCRFHGNIAELKGVPIQLLRNQEICMNWMNQRITKPIPNPILTLEDRTLLLQDQILLLLNQMIFQVLNLLNLKQNLRLQGNS